MSDLNLELIQAGLGVSLKKFSKIRKIVQIEVEKAGFGKKTLETNQMNKKLVILQKNLRKRQKSI